MARYSSSQTSASVLARSPTEPDSFEECSHQLVPIGDRHVAVTHLGERQVLNVHEADDDALDIAVEASAGEVSTLPDDPAIDRRGLSGRTRPAGRVAQASNR